MKADIAEVMHLKGLLNDFATSIGLHVNFHKSSMVSINVSDVDMQDLAGAFGCQIATMPFTYLWMPMGTTKPRMDDLTPLMDRVERWLNACSNFLSYSGRLEMIKYVITPIVTYAMCSLKLTIGVIKTLIGSESNVYGVAMIKPKKVET